MTPALLREAGEALYGERWQSDLARALGVEVRTVQRWATGDRTPAPGVWADIRELVKQRGAALAVIRRRLRGTA